MFAYEVRQSFFATVICDRGSFASSTYQGNGINRSLLHQQFLDRLHRWPPSASGSNRGANRREDLFDSLQEPTKCEQVSWVTARVMHRVKMKKDLVRGIEHSPLRGQEGRQPRSLISYVNGQVRRHHLPASQASTPARSD